MAPIAGAARIDSKDGSALLDDQQWWVKLVEATNNCLGLRIERRKPI
jgi:hypothetical protein